MSLLSIVGSRHRGVDLLPFITEWETTTVNETITIPLIAGESYDFLYRVDGGPWINHVTDSLVIIIPTIGTHIIEITTEGNEFPGIRFGNTGDKLKITRVLQWGTFPWMDSGLIAAFWGCSNLVSMVSLTGLSISGEMSSFVRNSGLTTFDFGNFDGSGITKLGVFASGCSNLTTILNAENVDFPMCDDFNGFILNSNSVSIFNCGGWSMSSAQIISQMFRNSIAFTVPDISGWDFSQVTAANFFMGNNSMLTPDYDGLLASLASQTLQPNVNIDFANSQYTIATSQANRDILTNAPNNWIISDGGGI